MENKMKEMLKLSDEIALENLNDIIAAVENNFVPYVVYFWSKHRLFYVIDTKEGYLRYNVLQPSFSVDEPAKNLETEVIKDKKAAAQFLKEVKKQFN